MEIINLSDISLQHKSLVGGKAFNLSQLIKWGFLVPTGFVLVGESTEVIENQEKILSAFDQFGFEKVAVRSSSSVEDSSLNSFAGLFDTYTNVSRSELIQKIEECFAAIHNPSLTEYCRANNVDQSKVSMSVVVQKMITADYAGVSFTKNPVTDSESEIMVEIAKGDGEQVVSGILTPTNFIINKNALLITYQSEQVSETELHIVKQVADISKKIESRFGQCTDIEWCAQAGEIFVLQARPITT